METGEKWDDPSPSFSFSLSLSPRFPAPSPTAHVLLQILVKKLKWIHEWSDTGTHGVSAVAKCATTDDSNRGFFATRARLGRSPNNNSTSSRAGEDDLSSLFDRLAVSVVCFPPTFLFFSLSLSSLLSLPSASIFRGIKEMEGLFFRRGEKGRKAGGDGGGSFDG